MDKNFQKLHSLLTLPMMMMMVHHLQSKKERERDKRLAILFQFWFQSCKDDRRAAAGVKVRKTRFKFKASDCSVTRLCEYSNFLGPYFLAEVLQTFGEDLAYFVRHHLPNKNCWGYFLGNIWAIFTPASGHTASERFFVSLWSCIGCTWIEAETKTICWPSRREKMECNYFAASKTMW